MDLWTYFFALVLLSFQRVKAVDLTLVPGATGSTVVKATVSKIRDSGIFSEDFDFLRNLAYVDSRDGASLTEFTPGGIWKVSQDTFTQSMNTSIGLSAYITGINSSFGIVWSSVGYENMTIPLYSALARRLHVVYLQTKTDMTLHSEANQAVFWAMHVTNSGETNTVFLDSITEISAGCERPDRDVAFLIDSSINSGIDAVSAAADFLNNVIERLKIDSNEDATVVGVAQYSNQVEVLTFLNSSISEADIKSLLRNTQVLSGERHTGLSVGYAITNFFQPSGARPVQTGTPRILCVVISGDSADLLGSIEQIANTYSVNVIAIAMTNAVTQTELNEVATGNDLHTAVVPGSFPPGYDVEFVVSKLICSASSALRASNSVSGELQQNEERSYTVPVSSEGIDIVLSLTSGNLGVYYSSTISFPSQAHYDHSTQVSFSRTQTTVSFVPTSEELGDAPYIDLYITLQGLSSSPTIFTMTVGDTEISISVTMAPNDSSGVSSAEISAIIFSGLVVLCAIIIASVYYRYGKSTGGSRRKNMSAKDNLRTDEKLEEHIRERMQTAMMKRSYSELNDALEDFLAMNMEDLDGNFVRAQRMLTVQQCKQDLNEAITTKNVKLLERSISRGKRQAHDLDLQIDLVHAETILHDLKKTDKLLRRLKRALDSGDEAIAQALSTEIRILHGCETTGVKQMLIAFQLRQDIAEAMLRRDVNDISECISRIEKARLETEFAHEMKVATRLEKGLAAVEKARRQVMTLKQSSISAIRSYESPPAGVHEVMMSVYLLLGYHPWQLQSWTAIQYLMGKTGREGLRKMISELELRNVDVLHAQMARALIEKQDLRALKDSNGALALFYHFSKVVMTEVQKNDADSESSPLNFKS